MNSYRNTVAKKITIPGVNIANGNENYLAILPREDEGITFINRRKNIKLDLNLESCINAYHMIIMRNGLFHYYRYVASIEHALGPLFVAGIDDAYIELSDGMVPTTENGSLRPYYEEILSSKKAKKWAKKEFYTIDQHVALPVRGKDKNDKIVAWPDEGLTIEYKVGALKYQAIPKQNLIYRVGVDDFGDIADARTQVFAPFDLSMKYRDWYGLLWYSWKFGFGHGATVKNTLQVGKKKDPCFINTPISEYEFIYHKLLDFVAVLAMLKKPLKDMHITVDNSGHATDLKFGRLLNKKLKKCTQSRGASR
jgi:UDP-3-O-acyl-N-acetylglucosamine deacetylase